MANETREQTSATQQSSTQPSQQSQQTQRPNETKHSGASRAQGERERPIESGREGSRQAHPSAGVVRQRESAPLHGGASNPFAVMRRMSEDMDRLFEQFGFGRAGLGLTPRFGSLLEDDLWSDRAMQTDSTLWSPQVETFRRGNNLVIRADIPGVKKDDIHVEVENDVLTISGERHDEQEEDRDGFYRSERSYGQFYRAIPLPEGVTGEKCDASFKDGVLEVTLPAPKPDERKAKRIPIK